VKGTEKNMKKKITVLTLCAMLFALSLPIDELLDYGLAPFLPGFRQTGFGRSGINGWPDGFWLTTE